MVSVNYILLLEAIKTFLISVLYNKTFYLTISGVLCTFGDIDDSMMSQYYDIPPPRTEYYRTYAKKNFTFHCPGANQSTLVEYLEWHSESKHKKVLEFQRDAGITYYHEWKNRVSMDKDYGLIFRNVSSADSGDYICLINHRLLPDVLIRFTVIDVPDPPGRPLITFFTARSANLSWTPPKGMSRKGIIFYTVIIRKHHERPDPEYQEEDMAKSTNFTITRVNTTNNESLFQVTHLRPYTVYSFQIIAWNAIGGGNPSKPSYFMVTLRELPEARIPFTARNMSSTSIFISWDQPDIDLINGDFFGYRLTWRQMNGPNVTQEKYIRNASVTKHIIVNLLPHTEYHIGLSVFNNEGYGPNTTLLIITDEGPPSSPRGLTVINTSDTSLTIQWQIPKMPNGCLKGYRIYFTHGNNTDHRNFEQDPENATKVFVLDELKPDTQYSITIKAFSAKHEGNLSEPAYGRTDILGPSPPILKNVSCDFNNSITVEVSKPENFTKSVDMYYIDVFETDAIYEHMTFPAERGVLSLQRTFANLTPNLLYKIQAYAASKSNRTGHLVIGEKSKYVTVFVTEGCYIPSKDMPEIWAGVVAGFICAISVLVLGASGYLIWKRYLQPPYYYLDSNHCAPASLEWNIRPVQRNEPEQPEPVPAPVNPPPPPVAAAAGAAPAAPAAPAAAGVAVAGNNERRRDYSGPILVGQFHEHVARLHADGDIAFSKEYDAIQNDPTNEGNSSENSQHPDNKPKNRYLNIIAYDHSRVQLLQMPGQKISTYINANYINGFLMNQAYIGTQGPLPSTFDCFWRMIWEQRVTIIVMITNLVERGRRKCDMYWPKEGSEIYGYIQVKLVKEDIMATYTIRTLVIRHIKVKRVKNDSMAEKTVYQYHYTNWPDHGTPDHPLPVISFVRKSSHANPPDSGPIVVHCSAGVGRTGTYIVLDAMLRQIQTRGEVNIYGFLKHIRFQRNFLVQTEEQYIFVHDALLEAIDGGDTDISREQFARYIEVLQNPESRTESESSWKPLNDQFQQVIKFKPRDFNLISANKTTNQKKNRCAILVPIESARVHLTPRPGEDGSDYINASWLPGFKSLREFIVTQHPLVKEEFWKMCYDHSVPLIVMLSIVDGEEFEVFWPEEDEVIKTDVFTCAQVSVSKNTPYVIREFLLKSVQDDFEIRTKFVQCLNWPHQGVASIKNMYDLPHFILGMQKEDLRPVCVVDRFGGTEAATFAILITLKRHLLYEQKVDIYMNAKLYHNKRPGVWLSVDDYMKLHLCVQTITSETDRYLEEVPPDMYSVANGIGGGKNRPSTSNNNCSGSRPSSSSADKGNCSRSPDGFPSASVAITIEDVDDARPSTSKENQHHHHHHPHHHHHDHDNKNDLERVPPEAIPLLRNLRSSNNNNKY